MRNTLSVLARWLAIGGLWLLIGLLVLPVLLLQSVTGAGIRVLEILKQTADELRGPK